MICVGIYRKIKTFFFRVWCEIFRWAKWKGVHARKSTDKTPHFNTL